MGKILIKPTVPDLIISLDPSSGSASALGICIIDSKLKKIIDIDEILPKGKYTSVEVRIRLIGLAIKSILAKYYHYESVLVATEYTVMKGRGGESLNRAIGAMIASLPLEKDGWQWKNIQNTTVKLLVAGTGSADKSQVAIGTENFFNHDQDSLEIIRNLIKLEKWDILDAIAIGITGYLQIIYGATDNEQKRIQSKKKKRI